jgi:hypothetical protein
MQPSEPITTGRDLALRLNKAFPERDWVAMLAERSSQTRDFVEWHLQQDLLPPEPILLAAGLLLEDAAEHPSGDG